MLQWQRFLKTHNYWNDCNTNCKNLFGIKRNLNIELAENIPISPIIELMYPKASEKNAALAIDKNNNNYYSVKSNSASVITTNASDLSIGNVALSMNNISSTEEKQNSDFDIFALPFRKIYKKFLEREKAPLELNISHEQRQSMESFYLMICQQESNKNILDEETFWSLWNALRHVCWDCIEVLFPALVRWQRSSFNLKADNSSL